MKISCTINSWNESFTIDLCLKALQGFADEVIVVDSGSIDGTPEIAQRWLDKLNFSGEVINIRSKVFFDFRSAALNACNGDWVFIQNSTTILSDALKKELVRHTEKTRTRFCDVRSLNLMGDYEHYFKNRPFMAPHRMLVPGSAKYDSSMCEPVFKGASNQAVNPAVNLSRVRPAWRSWYRGEPFDRRYYGLDNKKWANEANRQRHWIRSGKFSDLIEFVEYKEGLTLQDVKTISKSWYLNQLQLEATPLTEKFRLRLPEVIVEEQKNPRFKLMKRGGKIIGRTPEL